MLDAKIKKDSQPTADDLLAGREFRCAAGNHRAYLVLRVSGKTTILRSIAGLVAPTKAESS